MFRTSRRRAIPVAWLWALIGSVGPAVVFAAPPGAPTGDPAVSPTALATRGQPVGPRSGRGLNSESSVPAAGWWLGPVGVAAAFAVVGGVSLAAKRFGLNLGTARVAGPIAVVGQTRLSPKHAVYLVRVGGRVLILGAGPGGSPATLGEITDPTELARFLPRPAVSRLGAGGAGATPQVAAMARPGGLDLRIGDDE